MKFGKLTKDNSTTVYGHIVAAGELREEFATNPHACGVSEALVGTLHHSRRIAAISRAEFNAAFLNVGLDELEPGEAGATLDELRTKYAAVGDKVEVVEGPHAGRNGVVAALDGGQVEVIFNDGAEPGEALVEADHMSLA